MDIPAYLPYYVLGGGFGILVAVLVGTRQALRHAEWEYEDRAKTLGTTAFLLVGWFLGAIAIAALGTYDAGPDRVPVIQYGILLPILIGGGLIFRSKVAARLIDAVPQHWLVGVQLYRALGAIFLVLYATGVMPGLFAWPAGLGDVLVGVLAPVVAIAHARAPRENADLIYAWNVFGLADLVVAVSTGILTSPSPLQLFAFDHPNELSSRFPLVLVPTFLVPVSVLLHLASLKKLHRTGLRRDALRTGAAAGA